MTIRCCGRNASRLGCYLFVPKFSHIKLVVAAVAMVLVMPGVAAAQSDAEDERDRVQDQRSQVEDEIDVLQASNAEVSAALDRLSGAVSAQREAVEAAQAEVEAADAAVAEADEALAAARHDVEVLRQAIEEMAIASYIHPPVQDLVQSFTVADFDDALVARTYLDARAKRDVDLLNLFNEAEAVAETRADESRAAAAAAADAASAATDALSTLQAQRSHQQQVAATVQVRIDDALAESAALADLDAELAAQIAAEQQALIERLPPEPAAVPASSGPEVPATPSPDAAPDQTPTTPSTTTPSPTTTVPSSPPPVDLNAPPLETVHGITVNTSISGQVSAMIEAAAADGVSLSGSGYRSSQRQIELRMAHCGTSYYAIWIMRSGSCSPPTAIPGRSLHERGLAIDFINCSSHSTDCFQWLDDNASDFGLHNLPSEPWHWSTTGG